MTAPRSFIRVGSCWVLGLAVAGLFVGCDSGPPPSGTRVYSSPEEIGTKNAELKDAMKGGAYGSAGKKAAGSVAP
ncbi:hypothetical protein [Paludisphaera soli]|uniref:hypothetical protein n=1 Tax=Paludisphaera soli TaxID=2712865 RepID=UPI0013E9E34A|nr:hypothetical protein [Paludisphaera soli]